MLNSDYTQHHSMTSYYEAFSVPPYLGKKAIATLHNQPTCDSRQAWTPPETPARPNSTYFIMQTTTAAELDSTCCEERSHPVYVDWSTKDLPFDLDAVAEKEVGRGGPKAMFPKLLYQLLEDAENEDFTNICAWQPHGRAFIIHDKKAFQNKIMPRYFTAKGVKYTSFRRQLNLYGFLRIVGPESADNNAYYHEMFLRGRPDLFRFVVRTRIRGTLRRSTLKVESEPDFAEFPPLPSLAPPAAQMMKSKQAMVKGRQCKAPNENKGHSHQMAIKNRSDKAATRPSETTPLKQRALHPVQPQAASPERLPNSPFYKRAASAEGKPPSSVIFDDSDDHSLVAFLEEVFAT